MTWLFLLINATNIFVNEFNFLFLYLQHINCPNLKEISLDFGRQDNDSTDLASMLDNLGRMCPKLRNVHIASPRLSNPTVLSLTGAKLRSVNESAHILL